MIKHFSLFSGIESFKKALTSLGVDNELVGYSEFDEYASVALAAIHGVSEDLNYGDITKIDETKVPDCDLITYGFPCQDISVAGLGKGIIEGETRSGLLYDALRIIKYKMPKYAIAENVKNLVGKRFKGDFNSLLEELDSYGYNNYWQVLNAKDYGIPQNRERVFVVSIRKDVDNGKFEFPKPYDGGLRLKDLLEDEVEEKYYIDNERTSILLNNLKDKEMLPGGINVSKQGKIFDGSTEVASCLLARDYKGLGNQSMTAVAEPKRLGGLYDKNGKKRQAGAVWDKESIGPTLDTMQGGHREPLIVASRGRNPNGLKLFTNLSGGKWDKIHESARRVYDEEGIAPTIPKKIVVGDDIKPSVSKNFEREKSSIGTSDKEIYQCGCKSGWQDNKVGLKVSPTLRAGNHHTSVLDNNYVIRKLTPLECWRLMGFTDEDYHKARQALEDKFYNGRDRSNSQMYKMAGNSIVVDVLEGILNNLLGEII